MAQQFIKGQTFQLRAVSLYDSPKQYRSEDGTVIHKVGEPTMKGIKKEGDDALVVCLEKFVGGGYLVEFPGGELGYADPNKILGNTSYEEAKAKKVAASTTTIKTGATKAPTPLEKLKALKAEKEACEMRLLELSEELPAAVQALQEARAEEEALLEEFEAKSA